jgi:hypothetical protein
LAVFITRLISETLHCTAWTLELSLMFEGPFHQLRVVDACAINCLCLNLYNGKCAGGVMKGMPLLIRSFSLLY